MLLVLLVADLVWMTFVVFAACCLMSFRYDTYQDEVRLLAGGAVAHATRKQLAGPRD